MAKKKAKTKSKAATKKTATAKKTTAPVAVDRSEEKPIAPMLLVQLSCSRLGATRKGDLDEIKTKADKNLLHLSKRLLDCEEHKAIVKLDTETNRWLGARSLPSHFKAGIYQIRPEAANEIDEELKNRAATRAVMIVELQEVYSLTLQKDRERLGPQFNAMDYPEVEELPSHFKMNWRFFTLGAPKGVEEFAPELFAREKERIGDLIESARAEGVALLRAGFAELVEHLIDRLKPTEDGKKKRFHSSNLANILEFIETFEMRNVGDDKELQKLLGDTKKLLSGVDADAIRASDLVRETFRDKFETVKKEAAKLIEDAPMRKIDPAAFEMEIG